MTILPIVFHDLIIGFELLVPTQGQRSDFFCMNCGVIFPAFTESISDLYSLYKQLETIAFL